MFVTTSGIDFELAIEVQSARKNEDFTTRRDRELPSVEGIGLPADNDAAVAPVDPNRTYAAACPFLNSGEQQLREGSV